MDPLEQPNPLESSRPRRLATAGLAAGLVATGLVGGAVLGAPVITGAQTTTSTPETQTTDPATTEQPATGEEVPAPGDHLRNALQPLVDDGTLTTDQLEAVITALQDAHPAGGHGPGGPGGHRGPDLDAAAEALGLTADEVRGALQDGTSLADLAAAEGVDPQVVIDALVGSMSERLDEAVAAGMLTQEEADAREAEAVERITAMVNGELPAGGPGGPRGPGFPGFAGLPGDDAAATSGS
jgi:hypothetical protein